mmetsp:Transcript_158929/g.289776  ORF Transcript_158929/g.289776 Transcript_158929/m.289776 type:complete len:586 (-) Transcript_158929:103-1860(-)
MLSEAVLKGLNSLTVEEAANVISNALVARPELAVTVVDRACPELTYAPAKALTARRGVGRIKSFNSENGYGFIACSELRETFGSDVFLHRAQIGSFSVDQDVSFAVLLNREHKPQAYDLQAVASTTSCPASASSAPSATAVATEVGVPPFLPPPLPLSVFLPYGQLPPEPQVHSSAKQWLGQDPADRFGDPILLRVRREREITHRIRCGAASSTDAQLLEQKGGSNQERGDSIFDMRFSGRVKSFHSANGFGFIECEELHRRFQRDVFVHRSQINECTVGMEVYFRIFLNSKGQPQAACLEKRSAADAGAAAEDCSAACAARETTSSGKAAAAEMDDKVSAKAAEKDVDSLFEGAICIICQEVLHRATSIQPCLHSFCSSCLGSWLQTSVQRPRAPARPDCPVCRTPVAGVSRNHTLDGLINGLLKAHPGKCRAADEIAELNAKDILAQVDYDMDNVNWARQLSALERQSDSEEEYEHLDEEDEDVWLPPVFQEDPEPEVADAPWTRSSHWLSRRQPERVSFEEVPSYVFPNLRPGSLGHLQVTPPALPGAALATAPMQYYNAYVRPRPAAGQMSVSARSELWTL